jgi:hypothetical protein
MPHCNLIADTSRLEEQVRALEQELSRFKSDSGAKGERSDLNKLLSDAVKARDGYQADCFAAQRESARLQKEVDAVRQYVPLSNTTQSSYLSCRIWDELLNPYLRPLSADQRKRQIDEDYS